jgi:type I restriction enzyme M protein
VPTAEILQQGANLQIVRYCLSPELQAAQELVATQSLVALKELVQVVRPTLTAEKTEEVSLQEISPGDFPALGYAQVAGRSILVSEQSLGKHSRQLLRKHDVLIAMKGSVGKVALIGERSSSDWVAGQSCLVLRLPDKGPLDARVLFMFLTSEVGQILLKQLVADGSTVPLIQLRELEKLRIPLPSRQEQQAIIAAFEHITAIERQIQELRGMQTQATQQYWALQHAPVC